MYYKFKKNSIYLCCIFLWISISILFGRTTLGQKLGNAGVQLYSKGRLFIYVLLAAAVFINGLYEKEIVLSVISAICLAASLLGSGEIVLFSILLFIIAARNVETEDIIKIFFWSHLAVLVLTVALAKGGMIPMNVMNRGAIVRSSFGFSHPNVFGGEILIVIQCYVLMRWKHIKNMEIFGTVILGMFLLKKSDCRMAIAVLLVFAVIVIVQKNVNLFSTQALYILALCTFFGLLVLTVVAAVYYTESNPYMVRADGILSGRFSLMHEIYDTQGITWIGQAIENEEFVGIDNSFGRILLVNGILPFILLIILGVSICRVFYKRQEKSYLIAFIMASLSGFIENSFFRMENNYCILLGAACMLGAYEYKKRIIGHDKNIDRAKL